MPLTYRGMAAGERKQQVLDVLERVGMAHRIQHYPAQPSGGQRQWVAVGRGLAGGLAGGSVSFVPLVAKCVLESGEATILIFHYQ